MTRSYKWLLGFWLLAYLAIPAPVRGQSPQTMPHTTVPLQEFLSRGMDFEQRRLWQKAADLYERGLRLYPKQHDLVERWKYAERFYSLSRRYHDRSFVDSLLHASEHEALALYREVLRKIQSHYVADVSLDHLVRQGYANLDLALSDEGFMRQNTAGLSENTIHDLRRELMRWPNRNIANIRDATTEARHAAGLCMQYGIQSRTAIVMEFVSAASESLDAYSAHLTPNRVRDLYALIDGNFVGLGIEVRGGQDGLEIINVLPESPAQQAQLRAGDRIVAVDGERIVGQSAEEAANRLQGKEGSPVVLDLESKEGEPRRASLIRREVIVHSVTDAQIVDEERGIGYLRLGSFQKLTVGDLRDAIQQLLRQGMQSLIIDVRGNPGGLLDVAVQVADLFIADGVLVSTQGRAWGQNWSHRAHTMNTWKFPLVVVVDGESASASEIFAGAIKGHARGRIVGTRTFGKGSVQSIFPLRSAKTALRLTTARFYAPDGHAYEGVGVLPDIRISRPVAEFGEEVPLSPQLDFANDVQIGQALHLLGAPDAGQPVLQSAAR